MRRVISTLIVSLIAAISIGFGFVATATPALASGSGSSHHYPSGIDPAERQAFENRLGYHENRNYPYGLIGFLLVITPIVLIVAHRAAPKLERS